MNRNGALEALPFPPLRAEIGDSVNLGFFIALDPAWSRFARFGSQSDHQA